MCCMADKMTHRLRVRSLLLISAALLGLVGHQLSLTTCQEFTHPGNVPCASDNRSVQQATWHTTNCLAHTGFLATVTPTIDSPATLTQDYGSSDIASPFLLTFPVIHPPT